MSKMESKEPEIQVPAWRRQSTDTAIWCGWFEWPRSHAADYPLLNPFQDFVELPLYFMYICCCFFFFWERHIYLSRDFSVSCEVISVFDAKNNFFSECARLALSLRLHSPRFRSLMLMLVFTPPEMVSEIKARARTCTSENNRIAKRTPIEKCHARFIGWLHEALA